MLQPEPTRPEPAPTPSSSGPRPPASPPEDRSDESLAPVLDLIARARARHRLIANLSAAFGALAAIALAAIPVLALAGAGKGFARPLSLGVACAALAAFAWFGPIRARLQARNLKAVARLLSSRLDSPALRAGLVPAVELGLELTGEKQPDFSPELARLHIASLAQEAEKADLGKAIPDKPLRMTSAAMLAAAAVFLVSAIIWREPFARGADFLVGAAQDPKAPQASVEPVNGDVELTYVYPAYTHLPERTVPNTNGEISAPPGTQVRLKTRADREVGKAYALVGEQAVPLTVQNKRDLTGTLVVTKPGSYRFRLASDRDKTLAEGPAIPISVEQDVAPKVEIASPQTDVEVDPNSSVKIRYDAEDDYGLSEVALVFKLPGSTKAKRVLIQRPAETPRRANGEWEWDVTALGLMAGDRVAYYIEAIDNDEVSGKKPGVSKTQYVKIFSQAEHNRQVLQKIEVQWEKLVGVLADRLEAPDRKPGAKAEQVQSQASLDALALDTAAGLSALAGELRKEKAPEHLWQALDNVGRAVGGKARATSDARQSLALWLRRGVTMESAPARRLQGALAAEIAEEENGVLYLESLLDEQRIEDLKALAKELSAKRRELADLLEQYRNAPTEEVKEQLLSDIARLKERMAELLKRMAELSKGINEEHMNPEALEALREASDSMQMMDAFDKLQELLHQGKVEEAMKAMEELGQQLDELEQGLNKAADEAQGRDDPLAKELNEFANQLDELERAQQDVLQETQQVRSNYKKLLDEQLAQRGPDFVEKLREKAAEAKKHLDGVQDDRNFFRREELGAAKEEMQTLEDALKVKDFDQAAQSAAKAQANARSLADDLKRQADDSRRYPGAYKELAEEAQRNAQEAEQAAQRLEEIKDSLSKLFPPPGKVMSAEDKARMQQLSEKQGQLEKQAGKLGEKMDELNQQAPLFPDEAQQMMEGVGERMGKAQGQLAGRNPSAAASEERGALDQLGQLKKGLQQKSGGQQGGAGRMVPWPWAGPGMRRGNDDGNGRADDEDVKVPGADQHQVPEEYRKDILDAMKQGAPDKYRDQVKRYYEEIVK